MRRLRDRKRRWAKPFAVMVRDLAAARGAVPRRGAGARAPRRARPPDRAAARRGGTASPRLAPSVATGNRRLGVFLPYTPLHHLLLEAVGRPLVLTSGNLTDEPLATDDADALARLAGLADGFLAHDREIRARYDDSVTRVVARRESVVRRARGYAPEPLPLPVATPVPLLAVGAELKHTFTLARGGRAHVAPHNGDLEDLATHRAFTDGLAHLSRLLALEPEVVVHDLHPEYLSTKYALERFPAGEARSPSSTTTRTSRPAPPSTGSRARSWASPTTAWAWATTARSGAARCSLADLRAYRRLARFGRAPMPGGALAVKRPYRMALGYLLGAEAVDGGARRIGRRPADPDPAAAFLARLDPRERRARAHAGRPLAQRPGGVVGGAAVRRGRGAARASGTWPSSRRRRRSTWSWRPATASRNAPPVPAGARGRAARLRPAAHAGGAAGGARRRPARRARSRPRSRPRSRRSRGRSSPRRSESHRGAVPCACRAACSRTGAWRRTCCAASAGDGFEVFINRQVPVNDGGVSYGQAAVAAARLGSGAAGAPIEED